MSTVSESYQPKLRTDSFFIPGPDGTYFHNARGWYKLAPKIPYGLVERVMPFLDGTRSMESITQNLNEAQRNAVNYVLQELRDHGFVRDAAPQADLLEPGLKSLYANEIGFLEAMAEQPEVRFKRFREARVLIDAPVLLEFALNALWGLGLKHGAVVNGAPKELERLSELRQYVDTAQNAIRVVSLEALELSPYDLVVQITTDLARAKQLAEHSAAAGVPLVQALLLKDQAWIQLPGLEQREPLSFWGRADLSSNSTSFDGAVWQGSRGAVMAHVTAQHAFRYLSQTAAPQASAYHFERFSLEATKHRIAPHMNERPVAAHSKGEAAQVFEALLTRVAVSEEEFSKRAAQLIDPQLGVLRELDERDYTQMPLNIAEVIVRDARIGAQDLCAYGVGTDFTTPRIRASKRGLELYSSTAFDARHGFRNGSSLKVWAFDLIGREPRLIAADLAFPTLRGAHPVALSGLASGMTWDEAVEKALIGLLLERTVRYAAQKALKIALLPLSELTDPKALRYLGMLERLELEVRIGLVQDEAPIAQIVTWLEGQPIALTANADPQLAIREALERTVQSQQSRLERQAAYDIQPLKGWREPIWRDATRPSASTSSLARLTDFFAASGWQPHIAVLDHDPAVEATGLIVVQAVLLEGTR